MSRSKKKSNGIKLWFPILCVVIVVITFYMIYDIKSKINENKQNFNMSENEYFSNEQSMVESENEVIESKTDKLVPNNIDNLSNEITTNNNKQTSNPGITDQKQKAIELVKKEYGEDDTVDYIFDYVNENGEYVIAVKDRTTATVKFYFRVNLENEKVELD